MQLRQLRLDRIDGGDDVGAGLAADDQQHGRAFVVEATGIAILHAIGDGGDIAQPQQAIIAGLQRQLPVLRGLAQLQRRLQLPVLLRACDRTQGTHRVGAADRLCHVLQRQPCVIEGIRVQRYANRRQRAAAHLHFAHARHLRQLLRQHGRTEVVQLARRERVRSQRQRQDRRLRRVDLAVLWHAGHAAGQLAASEVDRSLHFARGLVDIAAEHELQFDLGLPLGAG
ncbi:hypothetical protein D3C81_801900 [compost metagenome]